MEKNNSKGGLVIGILIGIIIMLVVGIGLFVTNTVSFKANSNDLESGNVTEDSESSNKSNNSYTYSQMKGLYTYESNDNNENGELAPVVNKLYLYEDGRFVYMLPVRTPYGYIGNYVIENNKIILNYEYQISGGSSLIVKVGERKDLLFNNDNTISDGSTKLVKENDSKEDEFLKDYDYKHIIETYTIQK